MEKCKRCFTIMYASEVNICDECKEEMLAEEPTGYICESCGRYHKQHPGGFGCVLCGGTSFEEEYL